MGVLAADGQQDLADGNAGAHALGLAEGTAHARLEPISSGTRQHLVDAQHMERMDPHAQVEGILACIHLHIIARMFSQHDT